MALRWDLKPAFPNAPEGSERARITRRSVISGALALTVFVCVANWNLPLWQVLVIGFGLVAAFDAGDMAAPFDDEPDNGEPLEGDGYDTRAWIER